MNIDFWLDPACPWCWLTSRWLLDVAPHRDIQIRWRPISLLMKNQTSPESPFFEKVTHTLGFLRVMESVRAESGDAPIGGLYTAMGTRIHHKRDSFASPVVVLADAGLDAKHAAAFDDPTWDAVIRAGMDEGLALTGTDVGTPIIAYETAGADRVAFFGPVISRRLPLDDALRLWDGVVQVATVPHVWELKRTRTETPDFTPVS